MLKKITLSITAFVLMLLLAEFTLRTIFPPVALTKESAYRFDRDYIVTLKSNIKKEFVHLPENGGKKVYWQTNSQGFRGQELLPSPQMRVMVYGDSNIQARFSTHENTFCAKLQKYLHTATKKNCEVINCGVIGAGPDQNLRRFTKEVKKYHPNLVIFHIFAENDFGDLLRNRLYELNADKLILAEEPIISDQQILATQKSQERAVFLQVLQDLVTPKSGQQLIQKIQQLCAEDFSDVYRLGLPRRKCTFVDYYDIDVATSPKSESAVVKRKLMQHVLKEAYKVAKQNDISFLVLVQPSAIDLTNNYFFSFADLQKIAPQYQPQNLTTTVSEICRVQQIPVLNLYNIFRDNNPQQLFFIKDNHWNNKGQELAAKEVVSHLQKSFFQNK